LARPKGSGKFNLDDEKLRQLETMGAIGLPIKHCAAILGCSKATLDRLVGDDPRVNESLSKGRSQAMVKAYRTAFELAVVERNVTMLIFWLKTQARWKEPDASEIEEGEE
jgi:hypothetical protein